jgi:hypothetical protein
MWWYAPLILALERLREEEHEFNASLCYIMKLSLTKPKQINKQNETRDVK